MNEISRGKSPQITILMSIYNGARWVEDAIQSILNQTFTDFEFIIVNDGSQDRSLEIIKRFATRDPRIVVIDKHNTGLADSLNQGIKHAKGAWIARIDADDLCAPDRLRMQYGLAQADSSLVLIGSGLQEIDEYGHPGKTYRYPASHNALLGRLTTMRPFFGHSSAFYRADIVKVLGGYRPCIKRSEDFDLWLRFSEVGKIACLGTPLVKIRKHPGQISHDEQGRRQLLDSRVAMVSYWLRQRSFVDPVTAYSDVDFDIFRKWVMERLEQDRVFEYYGFLGRIKRQLSGEDRSVTALLRLFMLVLQEPGFVLRFLRYKVVGERLSKTLAVAWLNRDQLSSQ